MFTTKLHAKIRHYVQFLQRFANRLWYPAITGVLAALDNFLVLIPTDGILISSTMLTPRRWIILGSSVAIGSTIGVILLATVVEYHGLPWILDVWPGVNESVTWAWTE